MNTPHKPKVHIRTTPVSELCPQLLIQDTEASYLDEKQCCIMGANSKTADLAANDPILQLAWIKDVLSNINVWNLRAKRNDLLIVVPLNNITVHRVSLLLGCVKIHHQWSPGLLRASMQNFYSGHISRKSVCLQPRTAPRLYQSTFSLIIALYINLHGQIRAKRIS